MFKKILHIQKGEPQPKVHPGRAMIQLIPHPDLAALSPLFNSLRLQHSYATSIPDPTQSQSPEPVNSITFIQESDPEQRVLYYTLIEHPDTDTDLDLTSGLASFLKDGAQKTPNIWQLMISGILSENLQQKEKTAGTTLSSQSRSIAELPQITAAAHADLRLLTGRYEDLSTQILPSPKAVFPGPLYNLVHGRLPKGSAIQLDAVAGHLTLLYLISGQILTCQETIEAKRLVLFEKENDELLIRACKDSQFLWINFTTL